MEIDMTLKGLTTTLIVALFLAVSCNQEPELSVPPRPTPEPAEIPSGSGVTYYVAPAGDDADPGTITQPWATIQHAADVMIAGDTLMLREGTYHQAVTTVNDGNASDGYIIFSAYPGERTIMDGTNVSESQNGFVVINDFIRLMGLEIQNWEENGIWIENSHHIEIADCKVHDVTYGIGVADGTHDFVLNRVEMYNFDLYGFDASPSGGADNYNGTINDSIAHSGRDRSQNVDGFALGHGDQYSFVFNRCLAYDVFDGFDISARDATINRSVAHDNWNSGFKLWQDNVTLLNSISYHNENSNVELDWDGNPGVTTIQNCTLVDAGTYNIWIENKGDRLRLFNSILAGGDNIGLAFEQMNDANYEGDHNIFHNDNAERAIAVGYEIDFSLNRIAAGEWTAYSGQDAGSLVASNAESLFSNMSNWDLHLSSESIAIDAGTNQLETQEDHDGNARPKGVGYDIGAYEHSSN